MEEELPIPNDRPLSQRQRPVAQKSQTCFRVVPPSQPLVLPGGQKKEMRIRKEWSQEEDSIFLEGLKKHKLQFDEIQRMIPHRSRSQVRTHYRYLARSIEANRKSKEFGGKDVRRLRTRGRPSRSMTENKPTELFLQLTKAVLDLEAEFPAKPKTKPPSRRFGSIMKFDSKEGEERGTPRHLTPLQSHRAPYVSYAPIIIIHPNFRVYTNVILNSFTTAPGIETTLGGVKRVVRPSK